MLTGIQEDILREILLWLWVGDLLLVVIVYQLGRLNGRMRA